MGAGDVIVMPNMSVPVGTDVIGEDNKRSSTDVENELLRRNLKNQEMTIVELRAQCQNFANQLAGLKLEIDSKHKANNILAQEIRELNEKVRVKDIALKASQDCIDHMNLKDRLFVKLVDDRFQAEIGDQ